MDFINKFSKFMRNTGPARVLVPFGVLLIVLGIIMSNFFSGEVIETTGKITGVIEDYNAEDKEMEYDVSVSYTADGKEYENTFYGLRGDYSVGEDIKVFYDSKDPNRISNSGNNAIFGLGMIAAGLVALIVGILRTARAFKLEKQFDQQAGKALPPVDFGDYKEKAGVRELYCRFDGNTFKPGYILEDADRNVLFECAMTKQALVGARVFQFTDHTTGAVSDHEVGHTTTETFNNEFFSVSSWFKFDGKNIWEMLHERGLRMITNLFSKFPNLIYEVSKNGQPFARIETSGQYVHEDDAEQHALNIPVGRYYYRIWTDTDDLETLFLTVFAISETEQTVVE